MPSPNGKQKTDTHCTHLIAHSLQVKLSICKVNLNWTKRYNLALLYRVNQFLMSNVLLTSNWAEFPRLMQQKVALELLDHPVQQIPVLRLCPMKIDIINRQFYLQTMNELNTVGIGFY